jgi:hypothetical protein
MESYLQLQGINKASQSQGPCSLQPVLKRQAVAILYKSTSYFVFTTSSTVLDGQME